MAFENDSRPEADSKGSLAPSEAGVRNNLNRIIFWVLGVMALVVVAASLAIHLYSHGREPHPAEGPAAGTAPSTQPQ